MRKASGTTAAAGSGRGSGRGSAGRGRPPHPEDADASAPFRRQKPSSKPPVPRAHEVAPLAPREEKDFIRCVCRCAPFVRVLVFLLHFFFGVFTGCGGCGARTANYVKAPSAKGPASHRGASPGGSAGKREGYGEVPEYLRARKEEWADEEHRRAEAEANACPPGMTVMPESERIETLSVLKDSLAEGVCSCVGGPLRLCIQLLTCAWVRHSQQRFGAHAARGGDARASAAQDGNGGENQRAGGRH